VSGILLLRRATISVWIVISFSGPLIYVVSVLVPGLFDGSHPPVELHQSMADMKSKFLEITWGARARGNCPSALGQKRPGRLRVRVSS
jgi:hypothetical protein